MQKVTTGLVLLAIALIGFLGGYAVNSVVKIELPAPEELETKLPTEESKVTIVNNCEEKEPEIEKGASPLTKFSKEYALTDTDLEEIKGLLNGEVSNLHLGMISDSGYFINVEYSDAGSGGFVSFAKVNGEFKVLTQGSGDTSDGRDRMEQTLIKICE